MLEENELWVGVLLTLKGKEQAAARAGLITPSCFELEERLGAQAAAPAHLQVLESYLWKKGKHFRWHKRWVRLRFSTVTYFRTQREAKQLGSITLRGLTIAKSTERAHAISIYVPSARRTYYFAGRDQAEQERWFTALKNAQL